ncbi:hypothetical protein BQ8420_23750 [Nocardiopsis sp. JB363]|nr:hypothetical protein BQ8420_23750 [Nocardiopsis sp. JB363]
MPVVPCACGSHLESLFLAALNSGRSLRVWVSQDLTCD